MNTLFRYSAFTLLVFIVILGVSSFLPSVYDRISGVAKVAVVQVHTELSVDSNFLQGVTSVDSIISELKTADKDSSVKAILLDINSGGGGVVASYELASEIQKLRKPVISVIREAGASGAYWAAISSDYVFANPLSIVGSVGVIASYLEFSDLMKNYGVDEVRVVSGDLKDLGSPYQNVSAQGRLELDRIVNETFQVFLNDFRRLRSVNESTLSEVVTGKIFLGRQAFELGLVDGLGGFDEAEAYLKNVLQVSSIRFVENSRQASILDLLSGVKSFNPLALVDKGLKISS